MNRMKPAFLISMFGAQALAVPAGFGSSGLAIGAQIAAPIHCERSCLQLAYAYELAGKDPDALAAATRSDVNDLKRLPERQLLPQIRRSRTHIEMTGVRPKTKLLAPRTLGHCRPEARVPEVAPVRAKRARKLP
jgi:hypothetical protein